MKPLDFKEGQTYVCTKAKKPWWTEGKEYTVAYNIDGIPVLVDNGGAKWTSNALSSFNNEFKLKEAVEKREYTLFDVNKVILRAYKLYDNDSQRLAFIKGYFAK